MDQIGGGACPESTSKMIVLEKLIFHVFKRIFPRCVLCPV